MDIVPLHFQTAGDLLGALSPVSQTQGQLGQNAGADGGRLAVHHEHLSGIVGGGDDGALVSAGKLGSHRQGHHALAIGYRFGKHLPKGGRRGLTGGGHHIALHQHFVKLMMVDVHAVHVLLLAKVDGQGYDGKTRLQFGADISGGIDHNTYVHRVAPLMIFCNSGAILS